MVTFGGFGTLFGNNLRSFVALVLVSTPLAAFGDSRAFDFSGFDKILVGHGLDIEVVVGSDFKVVAQSDHSKQLERLNLTQKNGTLIADMDSRPFLSLTRSTGWQVSVKIEMPELSEAETTSGATLKLDRVTGNGVKLEAVSGSELLVGEIASDLVTVSTASGARMKVASGACKSLIAQASSGSSLDVDSMSCDVVNVDVSSGGQAEILTNASLTAEVTSGGQLLVSGSPEIRQTKTSSGGGIDFLN